MEHFVQFKRTDFDNVTQDKEKEDKKEKEKEKEKEKKEKDKDIKKHEKLKWKKKKLSAKSTEVIGKSLSCFFPDLFEQLS